MNAPEETNAPTPTPESTSPPTPPPPAPDDGLPSAEEKQWGMFAHLSALLGGLLTCAVGGWGVFVGPLVIWLVQKDKMKFVDDQGKEALNFNISVAIACVALLIFSFVTLGIGLVIAVPLWLIIGIAWLVLTIIASIKASNGEYYRYPMTLRLVK